MPSRLNLRKYSLTSLYAIDRDQKIRLAYKKFLYKVTNNYCKLGICSRKMVNLQLQKHEFEYKKTAYNEVHLYAKVIIQKCTKS